MGPAQASNPYSPWSQVIARPARSWPLDLRRGMPSPGPPCGTAGGGGVPAVEDLGQPAQWGGARGSRGWARQQVCSCCGPTASGPGSSCCPCGAWVFELGWDLGRVCLPQSHVPCLAPPSPWDEGWGIEAPWEGESTGAWGPGHPPTTVPSKLRCSLSQWEAPSAQ